VVRSRTTLACAVVAALAAAACSRTAADRGLASAGALRGANVLLITVDTLRQDRVGAYGNHGGLTPHIDRLAAAGVRYAHAFSPAPLTLPAHASILTGLLPRRHGLHNNTRVRLDEHVPTLATSLKRAGYRTGAFVGAFVLDGRFGLNQGFDEYDDRLPRGDRASFHFAERRGADVVTAAGDWILSQRPGRQSAEGATAAATSPWFAWVHLFDPHAPYDAPAEYRAGRAPYDAEVAYADAMLGQLLARLSAAHALDSTLVVVTADHGESLGEHGERTHGTFLYDATVRVPLIIKLPDATAPRVVDVPVEAADLAPTIASIAGTALDAVDGRSLLPLLGGGAGDPDRPAYAESYYQNVLLGWSPLRAVRTRRWKFIEAPRSELYDLASDPGELQNRIGDRATLASGLQRALPRVSESAGGPQPSAAAADAAERLRSLGYVSGATVPTPATRAVDPKDRVDVWAAIEEGADQMTHDPAAARRALARALHLDPGNGLAMKYLADVSFRAGELREARDGYRRAIAAGFRHPDAFVNLAAIAEREGNRDEARAALAEAVRIAPSDADAWNRLGLLEAQRGALDGARRAFAAAMAAAPERAEPYYNLAMVERRAGNEAVARARLKEALARDPSYPEAHYEIGTTELAAKHPARALEEYRAALDTRPDYAEALFGAARAELDLGRSGEARRDYERFVRVAPPEYRTQIAAAREVIARIAKERSGRQNR
jgi:choline-sulfatase